MKSKMVRKNISRREAACPHCGELPSDRLLDSLQALRDACGFPLKFTSIYRCKFHNAEIGGHPGSLHVLGNHPGGYGAADIGIHKRYRKKRYTIVKAVFSIPEFNNLGVLNASLHIGIAPKDHPQLGSLYIGISK